MRLAGFKTFVSPTLLEFAEGVTAVVGANGSGKSNIVDALKWVLGEQSMRDLRSRRNEDVIFSGAQTRRPASMAEVSLTLGNEGGWLPVDGSEVELIRRLYRSGESEYLMNTRRVRLRDILNVVRGGGLGAGGHTIVGQGMVDAVLSLRGVERRGYIASVAGVAPYEARRAEALNRLEQTRRDMASARVVYEEMEPRLRLLRRQANLAENALAARQELGEALQWSYARQWHGATADRESAGAQLSVWRERLQSLRAAIEEAESERERFQRDVEAVRMEREARRDRFMAAEYALKRADDGHASAHVALSRLLAELEQLTQQAKTLGQDSRLDTTLASLTSRAGMLQARRAELQESVESLIRDLAGKKRERDQRIAGKNTAMTHLATLRAAGQDNAAMRARLRAEVDRIEEAVALRERESPSLVEALESTRRESEMIKRELDASLVLLEEARSARNQALESTRLPRSKLAEAVAERDGSRRAIETAMSEIAALANRRLAARSTPTVIESIRFPGELAGAVAAALDSVNQSPVAPAPGEAGPRPGPMPTAAWRQAIAGAIGGTGVTPVGWLDKLVECEAPSPFRNLMASCLVFPAGTDLDRLWDSVRTRPALTVGHAALRLVSVDGQRREAGVATRAGESARQSARHEVARREVELRVTELTRRTANLDAEVSDLEAKVADALQAENEAESAVESAGEVASRWRAASAELARRMEGLSEQLKAAEERSSELKATRSTAVQQLAAATAGAGESDVALREVERAIDGLDGELFVIAAGVSEIEEVLRDLRGELSVLDRQIELDTAERDRLARLQAAAERERAGVSERLGQMQTKREDAERALTAAGATLEAAKEEMETARILLAEAPHEPSKLEAEGGFAKLKVLHQQSEEGAASVQKFQSEVEHLDTLQARLVADCRLDLDRHPSELPPAGDREFTEVEIRRLRVRAEQAEGIEPGAAEEFALLSSRRAVLEEQLTDLGEASETVESMLRDADREVRRRFRLTFAQVNELFGEFFRDIFGGGAAELLFESVDEVESVEIIAQLPGKRARDLSGLSGGERTLVAGAFLFGLISAAPPPFCVLDEVDAALDESNVDRYLGILKQLAEQTQFVVVTHNRGTMAAANTLYGIVLDPNGGSQALSLRLDQALAG